MNCLLSVEEIMLSNYLSLDSYTQCDLFASGLCFLINKTISHIETLNQNENYFDQ